MATPVSLAVGTHKGGFLLHSDPSRSRWTLQGPFFRGTDVNHIASDRGNGGTLWASVNNAWFGSGIHFSRDGGSTWDEPGRQVQFEEAGERKLEKIWCVIPGGDAAPGVLYAGVAPAALFVSHDHGDTWSELPALANHPSHERWSPGAGGLMVHSICPHPHDPNKLVVGISAAGAFCSQDGGQSWVPINQGVRADFLPEKYPEVGQCVHHLESHSAQPDLLYQQNHCGVYRSEDYGANWIDISEGLPSRFGFPLLIHPRDPDTIYVVPEEAPEFRCPVDGAFAVYRSQNRGESWQRLDRGLPQEGAYLQVYRQSLCADRADPAGIYVGTSTGQIFASYNEGEDWVLMRDCLPPIYSLAAI